jgi:4a-hydroxytetrahydrobiopterin dehydratase
MKRTPYSPDQIAQALQQLPGWQYKDHAIEKSYTFGTFVQAFAFLTQLALVSEKMDHHAEIYNVYNQVRIRLNTHDAKGITDFDVALARKLEEFAR